MNAELIIDVVTNKLLPRMQKPFRLLPHPVSIIPSSDQYQPVHPYGFHSHNVFEWVWCVEEHSFLQIQDTVYRLDAGDFCLLPPGVAHADVYIPALTKNQMLWGTLDEEILLIRLHEYAPINRMQLKAGVKAGAPLHTSSVLMLLQQEMRSPLPHAEDIAKTTLTILARLMLRACELHLVDDNFANLTIRVNLYLQAHYNEDLSLAKIAAALHVSKNYLAASYKQESGQTIWQALTEIRLMHGMELLLRNQFSIKEIAQKVGYQSGEHFSRVFVKHVGVTPGRYGKQL